MTAININQYQQMTNEWAAFQNSYFSASSALANVIAQGTIIYNDPVLLAAFPTSFPAYQAYLLTLQTYINTFVAGLPVAPVLNG